MGGDAGDAKIKEARKKVQLVLRWDGGVLVVDACFLVVQLADQSTCHSFNHSTS